MVSITDRLDSRLVRSLGSRSGGLGLDLAAVLDDHLDRGVPVAAARVRLDPFDALHALHHVSEHHVLPVEPAGGFVRDVKLRSVGVGSRVGHGEHARLLVLDVGLVFPPLVRESRAEDALGPGSVAVDDVAALRHEAFYDAVQPDALVVHRLAGADAVAAFARAEAAKVLARLRERRGEELELHAADVLLLAVLLHGFEHHEASHVSRVARDAIEGQLEDGQGLHVLHELHGAVR
mmetsp:Transcript_12336/g.49502  ORF Transcript_12336/g.49502 Transcript_12336/m.49502 type:complete len:235 (+) Transcript_12336:1711-2415(+)